MAHNITQNNLLFRLYARYAGEPESRKDAYGYWLFVFGSVTAFVGVVTFLLGPTTTPEPNYLVREIAFGLAALGLPAALLGIILLFPVKRNGIYAAGAGAGIGLASVVGFTFVYPDNWAVGTADYSGYVIVAYTIGVAIEVAVAALIPVVTGEKSLFFEAEYEREREYPAVEVGESDRGGLFSVFRDGEEWTWRLIEQDAIAGEGEGFLSRLETEEAVERVKSQVGEAGMMEIRNAAFRLYEAADERWRWLLMRADGSVVADSGEAFDDRDVAAESMNELKELGPTATVLRIDGAAFDFRTDAGEWRWRLLDETRTPLLAGVEGHDARDDAEAAAERVRTQAADAGVLAIEAYGIELFDADGDWQWRLLDADERVLATSATEYGSRGDAESAVYDLLENATGAPIVDRGKPSYEVTPADGAWTWRLVSGAEQVLARSHERTADRGSARRTAESMADTVADAEVVLMDDTDFEYYRTGDGWQWRLVTADREAVAESDAAFGSREAAAEAIEDVKTQAAAAELIEYEDAAFQVYETDGEWRWRLIDEDGNVMTDSGAEHDSRDEAMTSMMTVKENAPNAELLEIETAAFELFERDGDWNWRLVDEAGDVTARGASWHDSRDDAREGMDRLTGRAAESPVRAMEGAIFQLYADDEDDWRWRFVDRDGTVLADSQSTYGTRDEAETAVDGEIRETAADAEVHAIETVAVQVLERGDQWEWRLLGVDREELAVGTDTYPSRGDAVAAIESIREHTVETPVFERKETTFLLSRRDGEWQWKLVGDDRTTLATGAGSYDERERAEEAIEQVKGLLPEAGTLRYDGAAFELSEDAGEWHWRLIDEDETVIAAGTERYETRDDAREAVEAVKAEVADASVLEIETAAFELHEDAGEWRWRLVDDNGRVLAESLRPHESRSEAREAMNTVKEFGPESVTEVAE